MLGEQGGREKLHKKKNKKIRLYALLIFTWNPYNFGKQEMEYVYCFPW